VGGAAIAFPAVATALELLAEEAAGCTKCKLAQLGRTQVVFSRGDPNADLMFVGEGPGAEEDKQGKPFVGRSGQLLDKLIREELGISPDDVYVGNTVKCRPPGNRDPEPDELTACWPYLEQQIALVDPKVIVTLGNFATKRLLETKEGITKLRGKSFPYMGRTLIPTFHPAAVLRGGGEQLAQMRADLVRAKVALG
jgi:DNA polymerase